MEILFQSHHAQVSDRMRERARVAVTKLGARLARAVNAVVRFEEDGPTRRVVARWLRKARPAFLVPRSPSPSIASKHRRGR